MDIVITLSQASRIETRYLPDVDAGQGVPVGWVEIRDSQHCLTIHAADAVGIPLLISALEDLIERH